MFRYTFFLLIFNALCANAQEQLGMRLERYAGLWGATLNPAQTAFNPNNWEINLFTADLFFQNSYAYLRDASLPKVLRNTEKVVSVNDITRERPLRESDIVQDFFNKARNMHAVFQTRITGPGFAFRFGEKNVIGISTATRANFSIFNIPSVLRYERISAVKLLEKVTIPATQLATMSWGEVGLHYSRLNDEGDYHVAWGISPKLLLGFTGAYARTDRAFSYISLGNDSLDFQAPIWEFGLTEGLLDEEWAAGSGSRLGGFGAGIDLGMSWAMPDDEGGYRWQLGASLNDLGSLKFNRGAERHKVQFEDLRTIDGSKLDGPELREYIREASNAFLGSPTASLSARQFSIGLPTRLSLQAQVQILPRFYGAAVWVQRLPIWRNALKTPNILGVVPRFEQRWFAFSLPLVLNEYQFLRIGMAARLGFLLIGTDHLGSLVKSAKLNGSDFYIGLKINDFDINFGTKKRSAGGGGGKQKRKKIKCYNF